MNNLTYARRIDAILSNLADGQQIDDSAAGKAITMWRKGDNYFCCYANDTHGLMGYAFKGDKFAVRNEVMRLAGF